MASGCSVEFRIAARMIGIVVSTLVETADIPTAPKVGDMDCCMLDITHVRALPFAPTIPPVVPRSISMGRMML